MTPAALSCLLETGKGGHVAQFTLHGPTLESGSCAGV